MKKMNASIIALLLILLSINVVFAVPAAPSLLPSHANSHSSDLTITEQIPAADYVAAAAYMGNSRQKIFHQLNCKFAKKALAKNRVYFESREEAVNAGYRPCRTCKP